MSCDFYDSDCCDFLDLICLLQHYFRPLTLNGAVNWFGLHGPQCEHALHFHHHYYLFDYCLYFDGCYWSYFESY